MTVNTTPKRTRTKKDNRLWSLPVQEYIKLDPSTITCVRIEKTGDENEHIIVHTTQGFAVVGHASDGLVALDVVEMIVAKANEFPEGS